MVYEPIKGDIVEKREIEYQNVNRRMEYGLNVDSKGM